MVNRLVGIVIIGLGLSSCVGTQTLYKGITKEKSTVEYLYDTELNTSEKIDTIGVATPLIADPKFTQAGNLVKKKAYAIPLIFINTWKSEHEYAPGENVIKEDISDFIKQALITETNRSTSIHADSTTSSDLILEISIDSIGARGLYKSDGYILFLLFAYSYSVSESADPGTAYSKLSYVLRNKEEVLLKGNSFNQVETEALVKSYASPKELRKFFSSNLTEGISTTLKANIEAITREVENYLINQKKP